jgi:hypothetical protein
MMEGSGAGSVLKNTRIRIRIRIRVRMRIRIPNTGISILIPLIILSVWQQVLWRRVADVRGQVRRVQVPEGGGTGARRLQLQRRLQQGVRIRRGQGQFLADPHHPFRFWIHIFALM